MSGQLPSMCGHPELLSGIGEYGTSEISRVWGVKDEQEFRFPLVVVLHDPGCTQEPDGKKSQEAKLVPHKLSHPERS